MIIFLNCILEISIKCLITSQLDLKMGKMLVPITSKCLDFKLVSNTLDMNFKKNFQFFLSNLMCFHSFKNYL
jgi:hypothetical protein